MKSISKVLSFIIPAILSSVIALNLFTAITVLWQNPEHKEIRYFAPGISCDLKQFPISHANCLSITQVKQNMDYTELY